MNILEVIELKKNYGDKEAVKGISFNLEEGEILGFLGPNGAGKSTTINILSTALRGTSGNIKYMGNDIKNYKNEYKSNLGIVPQSLAIFENLPAIENVKYFASFYGLKGENLVKKSEEALEMVGLLERAKELPSTFSGGMKRRLNIACALAHKPKIIILDEPTVGIDPQSRNHILDSIRKLRGNGATVIYTTHYMEEVETLCDRVLIVDRGQIIAGGTIESLRESINTNNVYNISVEGLEKIDINSVKEIEGVEEVEIKDQFKVVTEKDADILDKIILKLVQNKVKIKNIQTEDKNLETVFLSLTGRKLRD